MRLPLVVLLLMSGCSELDPEFAVSQWFDGVEVNRPTQQGLHTAPGSAAPGEWSRTTARARTDESAWHFGDGTTYPALANASLQTPEFEAGQRSFLRFSYWSDVQTLSDATATDGMVIEGRVEDGEWLPLVPAAGYTHALDPVVLGSPLSKDVGVLAGADQTWHDDWVELTGAEAGQAIRFRFRFGCDIDETNNSGEGMYVDDVEFLIVE